MFAHINPKPESAAVAFDWFAQEVTKQSKGELLVEFYGSTLLAKEVEIMNAVKSGNIAKAGAHPRLLIDGAVIAEHDFPRHGQDEDSRNDSCDKQTQRCAAEHRKTCHIPRSRDQLQPKS